MFKYFRISQNSLANLAASQLYCHHYAAFNDPFECWCVERRDVPDALKEPERYSRVRAAWLGPEHPVDPTVDDLFAEYVESLTTYPWSIVDNTKNNARISCFSESGDNLLMWAHYGDGLRGFCLEFDEQEILRGTPDGAHLLAVQYRDNPEPFDLCLYEVARDQMEWHEHQIAKARAKGEPVEFGLGDDFARVAANSKRLMHEIYAKLLATKPREWHYEREIRLIFRVLKDDFSGVFYKFPRAAIKSVIVGDKITDENRTKISNALRQVEIEIPLLVASRDPSSFRVSVRPI
jgi:hypothetical protein